MITRSADYVEYCRDTARRLRNLQDLALRGKNKEALTRRVQERIVHEVALTADDDIVDIGCGDGTLLLLAKKAGVRSATGFHATEEESAIVRSLGVDARQGYTDSLPLSDECASVVVCNNVLLIVPREKIPASLREIHRVAKPGARVLIGEIPFEPGPPPEPEFVTARETLAYLYRKYGLRTFLGMLRRMVYWKVTGQPMTIRYGSQVSFYAQPDEFIAMAQSAGLELIRSWQHDDPANRYNYLFRKADSSARSAPNPLTDSSHPAA
jgi:ubiquinone/menaquinone biosynthesis C-methylase UbiE